MSEVFPNALVVQLIKGNGSIKLIWAGCFLVGKRLLK